MVIMMIEKQYTYLNYSKDGYIGSFYENDKPLTTKEVWDRLNEQEETIQELKTRNKRQYERLKEKEEYCDNICKSFEDYYGMNIENAEWFGFNGDVE